MKGVDRQPNLRKSHLTRRHPLIKLTVNIGIFFTIPTFTVSTRMYGAYEMMIGWRAVFGATHLKIVPIQGGVSLSAWVRALRPTRVEVASSPASSEFWRQNKAYKVIQHSKGCAINIGFKRAHWPMEWVYWPIEWVHWPIEMASLAP